MKRRERLLLGVILALYSLSSIAQETSDYSRLFVGQAEQPYSATQYNQSTYLGGNDEVQRGKICYFGKTYDNILMRYDLLKSQIVLCSPSTNILTVPDQDHVDWFEINGQRWVKHQYGIISIVTRTGKMTNFPIEKTASYNIYDFPEKHPSIKE